jgi:hypothetical protein
VRSVCAAASAVGARIATAKTVRLTVRDDSGLTGTTTQQVTVSP